MIRLLFSSCTGLIEFAIKKNSVIGGDDFKSGQTKMKSVLVDFLVGAGIKVQILHLCPICWMLQNNRFSVTDQTRKFRVCVTVAHLNCQLQPPRKQ